MHFLKTDVPTLGMGCWPIGGAMFSGTESLGYSNAEDGESLRTIHAALDHGVTLFDTAAAYGAGHAERLLGRALKHRPDAAVVTKIGIKIDEESKQLTFEETRPDTVQSAIDACLCRLDRECIDLLLFHQNSFPIEKATLIFDEMEVARQAGKIRAYGWSTDFAQNARAMAARPGFVAIEHAMNVLLDAPSVQNAVQECDLAALIRSPLAMGLLSGKYDSNSTMPASDIRATDNLTVHYFKDAKVNPQFMESVNAVQALLRTGGRTLTQGALGWIWARSADNIPVPGARTVAQIEELAKAAQFGPLPESVMAEIETLLDREEARAPDRER